jgi:hypothetical protein
MPSVVIPKHSSPFRGGLLSNINQIIPSRAGSIEYFSFKKEIIGWVNSRLERRESATDDTTAGLIICLVTFEVGAFAFVMDASEFCRGMGLTIDA